MTSQQKGVLVKGLCKWGERIVKFKKYKNFVGLCAVPGCFRFASTAFSYKNPKKNKRQVVCTCLDCSFKVYELMWNNF